MALCDNPGSGIRSVEWLHAGDVGRLCTQWNIDYCLLDDDDSNGENALVWDDFGRQAAIQYNAEVFDTNPDN